MQVRGPQTIGFSDQMTGQPYDKGIVFINGTGGKIGDRIGGNLFDQFSEQRSDGRTAPWYRERAEKLLNIATQSHRIADRHSRKCSPDVPPAFEVVRIMGQHIEQLGSARDRKP